MAPGKVLRHVIYSTKKRGPLGPCFLVRVISRNKQGLLIHFLLVVLII